MTFAQDEWLSSTEPGLPVDSRFPALCAGKRSRLIEFLVRLRLDFSPALLSLHPLPVPPPRREGEGTCPIAASGRGALRRFAIHSERSWTCRGFGLVSTLHVFTPTLSLPRQGGGNPIQSWEGTCLIAASGRGALGRYAIHSERSWTCRGFGLVSTLHVFTPTLSLRDRVGRVMGASAFRLRFHAPWLHPHPVPPPSRGREPVDTPRSGRLLICGLPPAAPSASSLPPSGP